MANKRIKDLSTTAAVTASDDFIAVDGATNGTRKLDAYNPTFGGNLTVSGTGTTALGGAGSIISLSASGRLQLGFTYSRVADPDGAGGWLGGYNIKFSTSPKYDATGATAGLYYSSNGVRIYSGGTAVADTAAPLVATFATTGNLLIGTATDSGNGKLQLATHTTSSGGIGFGTDWTIYRQGANDLNLGTSTASVGIQTSGTLARLLLSGAGEIYTDSNGLIAAGRFGSGQLTLRSVGANSVILQTNSTTALTLDSSQRCILAGALRLNNAYTASAVVPTGYVTIQDSTGTTYKVCVLL